MAKIQIPRFDAWDCGTYRACVFCNCTFIQGLYDSLYLICIPNFPYSYLETKTIFFSQLRNNRHWILYLDLSQPEIKVKVWSFKPDVKAFFWLLCLVILVNARGESYTRHQRSQNDLSEYSWEHSKVDHHLKILTPNFFYLLQSHLL